MNLVEVQVLQDKNTLKVLPKAAQGLHMQVMALIDLVTEKLLCRQEHQ
ncbi:hypothetical protein [Budvicia aquatica]|nr:hypothetical protein [Budvicia aquatica]